MPLTQYYVDPAINANSGTGTSGDPFGDLQYALNTITRDATNGDQINIKAGTAESLAAILSLATYGTPTATAPLSIRGYTTTANDGGIGEINANGGAAIPSAIIFLRDLNIHNGGSSTLVTLGAPIINCRVANTSGTGILSGLHIVMGCEITDCSTGINASAAGGLIYGNYFKAGGVRNFTQAINASAGPVDIIRNIFSVGTSGNAILITAARQRIINNSILASGSTGSGITQNNQSHYNSSVIIGNVIEGFSCAGGSGINFGGTTNYSGRYASNAFFNNTTNVNSPGVADDLDNNDNEILASTGFAKSGSDTFANRFVYFAPVNTGNIFGGAVQ